MVDLRWGRTFDVDSAGTARLYTGQWTETHIRQRILVLHVRKIDDGDDVLSFAGTMSISKGEECVQCACRDHTYAVRIGHRPSETRRPLPTADMLASCWLNIRTICLLSFRFDSAAFTVSY